MTIDEAREHLSAYLDGELDDAASRAVEAALEASHGLRDELASLHRTVGLVHSLPRRHAPAGLAGRVACAMAAEAASRPAVHRGVLRRWRPAILAAAACLLVGFAAYLINRPSVPRATAHRPPAKPAATEQPVADGYALARRELAQDKLAAGAPQPLAKEGTLRAGERGGTFAYGLGEPEEAERLRKGGAELGAPAKPAAPPAPAAEPPPPRPELAFSVPKDAPIPGEAPRAGKAGYAPDHERRSKVTDERDAELGDIVQKKEQKPPVAIDETTNGARTRVHKAKGEAQKALSPSQSATATPPSSETPRAQQQLEVAEGRKADDGKGAGAEAKPHTGALYATAPKAPAQVAEALDRAGLKDDALALVIEGEASEKKEPRGRATGAAGAGQGGADARAREVGLVYSDLRRCLAEVRSALTAARVPFEIRPQGSGRFVVEARVPERQVDALLARLAPVAQAPGPDQRAAVAARSVTPRPEGTPMAKEKPAGRDLAELKQAEQAKDADGELVRLVMRFQPGAEAAGKAAAEKK